MIKFQLLKTASIEEAKGALGEWDLTEANNEKAWTRLSTIYDDEYMQIQSFNRKLHSVKPMQKASSKAIRQMIDTVHKCVQGLERYYPKEYVDPFVVFLVIDRMDKDTYRSWEKHRQNVLKKLPANAEPMDEDAQASNVQPASKAVPTWAQLEKFLEDEASIHVHEEKRIEDRQQLSTSTGNTQGNRPMLKPSTGAVSKRYPSNVTCSLCEGPHPVYKCRNFRDLGLNGRKDHVQNNNLCPRCLRSEHGDYPCANPESMKQCMRCKPGSNQQKRLKCELRC